MVGHAGVTPPGERVSANAVAAPPATSTARPVQNHQRVAIDPPDPDGLATALSTRFDVDLREAASANRAWELRVIDPTG